MFYIDETNLNCIKIKRLIPVILAEQKIVHWPFLN